MLERSTIPPQRLPRTLRAARIIFNNNNSTFDCTVRRMSGTGALLQLGSTYALPQEFILELKPFKERYQCVVTRRALDGVEVDFVTPDWT